VGAGLRFSPGRAAVIAPHFFAVHAFVFVIPGSVSRKNQEHRMRRSVVAVNPAPNSAWAGGVAEAPLSETQ
jgi:hypothetical protein